MLPACSKETADDLTEALEEVTVDDDENALGHLHGAHASGHFGNAPEGHVIVEHQVQVGLALLHALVDHAGQPPVDKPGQSALGVVHLAQGVVHGECAAPGPIGDGVAQQILKFNVGHVLCWGKIA